MTSGEDVRRRAVELLESGSLGDAALRSSATVLDPTPVVEPSGGELHSWFVPFAVGERLAGFAELRPDLELVRYSGFEPGETAELPALAAWTDPDAIRRRAATVAAPGETLGEPVLTYDGVPSRLAWRVTATDAAGRERALFVAGDHAYAQPSGPRETGVGGGPPA